MAIGSIPPSGETRYAIVLVKPNPVALILTACLLVDPATATVFSPNRMDSNQTNAGFLFQEQALSNLATQFTSRLNQKAASAQFRREAQVQDRLLARGLFAAPIAIDGKPVTVHFVTEFLERPEWPNVASDVAERILETEKGAQKRGKLSVAESSLLDRHVAHFEAFARGISAILRRNPWSLVAFNAKGELIGVVFSAFVHADSADDLPSTSVQMTHAHQQQGPWWNFRNRLRRRNAFVDFWFTGNSTEAAELMIRSSLKVAEHLSLDAVYPYSNGRGLPLHPEYSPEDYLKAVESGKIKDPAVNFHSRLGAKIVRIIRNAFPLITTDKVAEKIPPSELIKLGIITPGKNQGEQPANRERRIGGGAAVIFRYAVPKPRLLRNSLKAA